MALVSVTHQLPLRPDSCTFFVEELGFTLYVPPTLRGCPQGKWYSVDDVLHYCLLGRDSTRPVRQQVLQEKLLDRCRLVRAVYKEAVPGTRIFNVYRFDACYPCDFEVLVRRAASTLTAASQGYEYTELVHQRTAYLARSLAGDTSDSHFTVHRCEPHHTQSRYERDLKQRTEPDYHKKKRERDQRCKEKKRLFKPWDALAGLPPLPEV